MPKIAGFLTLICVLALCGATASAQTCEYAGQTFSLGSTVCECPNLRIVRSANSAGRGEITSRRLTCSKDQSWVNTNSLCLVAYTSADHAEDRRITKSHHRGDRKVFQLGAAEPSGRSRPGHLPPVCQFI